MQLNAFLTFLAAVLPVVYGAPPALASSLHPSILAAMKRDLGLDASQATARVALENRAADIVESLSSSAGFAGAWMEGSTLHVGVSDEALSAEVLAAGATPVVVATPLSKLQEAKAALDNLDISKADSKKRSLVERETEAGIAAYYVDVASNKLVFEALADSVEHAASLAQSVGLSAEEFEVRTVDAMPVTYATVQGGTAYYIDNVARCSEGFTVTTGFVSAGHCGSVGSTARSAQGTGTVLGTFAGDVFPGSADMSYIRTASGNTLSGTINGYGTGTVRVTGSTVAASGSSVCRSGSTSGVHCGTVRASGATVTYSEGRVTGLTQTTVCAEPGDSGGPFYSGTQAQGVTSGGSGDCTSGGVTYFQPVKEILSTYGLTLVTS
jgi:hypothetical protein